MVANPYLNLEDKELMLRYKDGAHMAFDVLYSRHKDKVYHYLNKRLHSKDDTDDLFQKVFIKFHKSRHLYQEKYEVLPWLYTITKSEFLDFLKKKNIQSVEFDERFHGATDLEKESSSSFDIESEKHLSDREKSALKLRYINEKEFSEISEVLKTSQSNSRKIISRALEKLRNNYRGENNE